MLLAPRDTNQGVCGVRENPQAIKLIAVSAIPVYKVVKILQ
jgi:hypothetical protein